MNIDQALAHIDRLSDQINKTRDDRYAIHGTKLQIAEFIKSVSGEKNSFYLSAHNAAGSDHHLQQMLSAVLSSFREHLTAGLLGAIGPERKAQIDVVSDFLDQANTLLNSNGVHPAAPIVIVGASLEEFLRTWVERESLALNGKKPSLEVYAHALLGRDLISKQDVKDITAWAGLRNHAAHGQWGEVAEKQRAALMLEGVNLFMRKYGGS